jgi:hypothetical protein
MNQNGRVGLLQKLEKFAWLVHMPSSLFHFLKLGCYSDYFFYYFIITAFSSQEFD